MIDYIFDSLLTTENVTRAIKKKLNQHTRFNRSVTAFAIAVTAYIFIAEIKNFDRDKKIVELDNKIEELKRTKGE